jgi:hypothetical protein
MHNRSRTAMNLFVLVTHRLQHFFAFMLRDFATTFFSQIAHCSNLSAKLLIQKHNEG